MGGSQPSAQTVTQKTELPAWLEDVTKENLALAQEVADRPYVPYTGQRISGFTPEQEQAFGIIQQGVGRTAPAFEAAQGAALGSAYYQPERVQAGSFLTGNIGEYMNPYIANVEQRAIEASGRSLEQARNQIAANAAQARAFGGSRQGLAEGVAAAESARNIGDLSARLRSEGFDRAAALQSADYARALQAAQANQAAGLQGAATNISGATALGALTQQAQAGRQQEAALVENVGQQRQAMAQAALDEAYARFLEERNYPIEGLNLRLAATSATPYGRTQTETRTGGPSGSSFLTGLGAVGTGSMAALNIAQLVSM
jgi:hypothetical protein